MLALPYVHEHVNSSSNDQSLSYHPQAGELLKLLKEAFRLNLPSVDWMVESTRRKAAAKLAAMVDMVGYGSVSASAEALDKYYERVGLEV